MVRILDKSIDQISKELNVRTDRYLQIISYVDQMVTDYKKNPVDVMKEIPMNLKGNERSFAIILTAGYFVSLYREMTEKERVEFTNLIAEGLKISQNISMMSIHMKDTLIKEIQKLSKPYLKTEKIDIGAKIETPVMDVIYNIINSKFTDAEKNYMMFEFVLISGTI